VIALFWVYTRKRSKQNLAATPVTQGFCISCGTSLRTGSRFCTECGSPVSGIERTESH